MIIFRQSTASQEFIIGKMVDSTDGATAETGLTIANTDIKFFPAGATTSTNKNSGGGTHIASGQYSAVADATDTATVGQGKIVVDVSGALVWERDYVVYPAPVYDWMFGVVTNLPVNVAQFGGSNGTFASGRPEVNTTHLAGTSQTARDIGASVLLSNGTGTGQVSLSSGRVALQSGIQRNVALRFPFIMKDSTGAPLTGSTVTVTYSHDGGSFASVGSATEIASGFYYVDLSQAIMNNEQVMLRMSGSGGSGTPADNAALLLTDP